MSHHFRREMGLTHNELFRLLPVAVDRRDHTVDGTTIRLSNGDQSVVIQLGPQYERKIASLTLPVTQVDLTFEGYTDSQAQAFIHRFDRTYQRGGG